MQGISLASFRDHVLHSELLPVLCACVVILLILFVYKYWLGAVGVNRQLKRLVRKVREQQKTDPSEIKRALDTVFSGTRCEKAWKEYEETLHEQHASIAGEPHTRGVRATVPAQAFFSVEVAIDTPIRAEFFKHLPGILTGIGIIGTFYGLVSGIAGFNPTNADPTVLTAGLKRLFDAVQYAFLFSGIAVGLAILVTVIEKHWYAACVERLSELNQALDGLFRSGVGEEYLSKLVEYSEDGANQTRQLKESLVSDLKVLLTELTERQIAATNNLSVTVGKQITDSLKEPLEQIAATVREASGSQTEKVGSVLENLMTAFMQQMRESMGGQLGDLAALLQQTATTLGGTEASIRTLVADLRTAGGEQTAGVTTAIQQILRDLELQRQSQDEALNRSIARVMEELERAITRLVEVQEKAEKRAEASMSVAVGKIAEGTKAIADSNNAVLAGTGEVLDKLAGQSSQAVEGLSRAADQLRTSVDGLGAVSSRLASLVQEIAGLEGQAIEAARANAAATLNLSTAGQQVAASSAGLAQAATQLQAVTSAAAAEADARRAILTHMQDAARQSIETSAQFSTLTAEVKQHLVANVEVFGGKVAEVLSSHLKDYQKELGDSVKMLSGALEELAEYADTRKG